ncbi:MAG: RpiB/LacA/LacB family sugar-phosphate isomerase [Candidatus Micrarchaeia archaeon]
MRILVISNVPKALDQVVDSLKGHNIVAKEMPMQTQELVDAVASELGKGYDVCVVVAKDPVGTGIALNKLSGVFAAVCNNPEDVGLGKANNANVFILKSKNEQNPEIINAISGLGYSKRFFSLQFPKFQLSLGKQQRQQQTQQPQQTKAKQQQAQQASKDEAEEQKGDGKGILGKIKNALGIV